MNQVVADCRDVQFLPRDYDVPFGADCQVVLFVDGRAGYVEVDLDPCLSVAIGLIVLLSKHGGGFAKIATL